MFENLVWATAALCLLGTLQAYFAYKDVFHPAIILLPMSAFMYGVMPLQLVSEGSLWTYVTVEQATWGQSIILGALACLLAGLHVGSAARSRISSPVSYDQRRLHHGAYIIGGVGLSAWAYVIRNSGGITEVFGRAKGIGWSEFGFIREAAYLIIVALLLLMSPQGFSPRNKKWLAAVVVLSIPYLIQGLLGAQRGPTFLIMVTLGASSYLARGKRPSLPFMLGAGIALGALLLILVTNRDRIHLGSEEEITTDVSGNFKANEAHEYIFGIGCMVAATEEGRFFWGKRYAAQVLVRPIPKQIWPNKYEDFGVPELLQNAGVAGPGLANIMGWGEVPGAAAAMVADIWVEFSWFTFPVMFFIGYWYASTWRKAVSAGGGPWITQYTVLMLLSIYMVSQSGEAVIFRMLILSFPTWWVWNKSRIS